ncbi:unnamed protein product [Hymenolepis diminuta]|uniref:Uncharacterized protein n=1 Tax=Hymenolepis diminuta TaxID=6216 RepID=A0A0R3SRC4_HYMDI|nr:unnamed protein product [Hymenolepis diminuta]
MEVESLCVSEGCQMVVKAPRRGVVLARRVCRGVELSRGRVGSGRNQSCQTVTTCQQGGRRRSFARSLREAFPASCHPNRKAVDFNPQSGWLYDRRYQRVICERRQQILETCGSVICFQLL